MLRTVDSPTQIASISSAEGRKLRGPNFATRCKRAEHRFASSSPLNPSNPLDATCHYLKNNFNSLK